MDPSLRGTQFHCPQCDVALSLTGTGGGGWEDDWAHYQCVSCKGLWLATRSGWVLLESGHVPQGATAPEISRVGLLLEG